MYSKEEASKIRQLFWITFGKYMKPVLSAEGLPINWVNYKTGVKHIFFRMNAEKNLASISIEITHPDAELRKLYFEQFKAFKTLLTAALNEEWDWQEIVINDFNTPFSEIAKTLNEVSIYNEQHWPTLISFLKPRMIILDQFWTDVKPVFEAL